MRLITRRRKKQETGKWRRQGDELTRIGKEIGIGERADSKFQLANTQVATRVQEMRERRPDEEREKR